MTDWTDAARQATATANLARATHSQARATAALASAKAREADSNQALAEQVARLSDLIAKMIEPLIAPPVENKGDILVRFYATEADDGVPMSTRRVWLTDQLSSRFVPGDDFDLLPDPNEEATHG